ncbi:MAG: MFS transporter [Methylacidiphilales bacterium]|nr:MFS transporter [Candidatus Methylacidiphilales bacterium]
MSTKSSSSSRTWQVGTLTYNFGGLVVLCCWLLWGDFAWSVRDRAVGPVMQLLLKNYGASDLVAGLLFGSLPGALGLIIGPVVGYKSDRLRTRWGRRIPFLFVTIPFIVLSVVGMAFCPQLGGFLHHFLGRHSPGANPSILIMLGIFWTLFGISTITAGSVFGALLNDVVPAEVLGRFFGLFRAVSLIAGMIFFFWLMGVAETHFTLIFLGVGVIYGVGFTLMCFKVKEGEYPPPPGVPGEAKNPLLAIKSYFKDGFGHSYYLWYFGATILAGIGVSTCFNLYSVFYAKSLSMDMTTYGKCITLTFFISLCLSYPLGILVDRFHPLRVSIFVLALYTGAMAYGFIFVHDAHVFAIALVVHGVVSGTFFTTSAALGLRLLPRSKFAEISSAGGVLGSLVGIATAPILGTFLDYMHHDYRYTFLAGFVFTAASAIAFLILQSKFMALGGPANYVAPE